MKPGGRDSHPVFRCSLLVAPLYPCNEQRECKGGEETRGKAERMRAKSSSTTHYASFPFRFPRPEQNGNEKRAWEDGAAWCSASWDLPTLDLPFPFRHLYPRGMETRGRHWEMKAPMDEKWLKTSLLAFDSRFPTLPWHRALSLGMQIAAAHLLTWRARKRWTRHVFHNIL